MYLLFFIKKKKWHKALEKKKVIENDKVWKAWKT